MPGEAIVEISEALVLAGLGADPDWRTLGNDWRIRAIAECPIGKEDDGGAHLRDTIEVIHEGGAVPSILCGSVLTREHGVSALDLIYSGTPAHVIRAKPGHALRFRGSGSAEGDIESGQWVFRRSVRHPGTKANKFVDRAIQQAIVMSGGSAFTG